MLQQYIQARAPLRLKGVVQRYAWGKEGASSRIAHFLKPDQALGPLAEFWLGVHPRGTADVILNSGETVALSALLEGNTALPFMLKVLSIHPEFGLSIQSHPDSETAKILHARDPQNYPDGSHKPEIGIALSPVKLLYGFKKFREIVRLLDELPELQVLLGDLRVKQLVSLREGHDKDVLRDVFRTLLSASPEQVARFVSAVLGRFAGGAGAPPEEVEIIRRLTPRHGTSDVGLVALCVMNIVTLAPGQGVFIAPNTPHAYLDGDLVECMACSDNVIRGGLTSKYRDIATLIETVDYGELEAFPIVSAERTPSGELAYRAPVQEFSLGVTRQSSGGCIVDTENGFSIVLCLGEGAAVSHVGSGAALSLSDGAAALLLKGSGRYELKPTTGDLFFVVGG
jgi:mannose-6-phosphate isomerase